MPKAEIRADMRTRRAAVGPVERAAVSQAITRRLLALPAFANARSVALFLSLPQELAMGDLLSDCHARAVRVCVPAWDAAQRTYVLVRLTPGQALTQSPHGVPEPAAWQPVDPADVDFVVVPGLAFDRQGGRLGYGKGYYDRILPACRPDCIKAAVAYSWQVVADKLPLTERDVRMDLVVTEHAVLDCRAPAPGR
jgi:5-formyltetrahydrofolate cyclo-ligase